MTTDTKAKGGRPSLYPGKVRGRTISMTMRDQELGKLERACARLQLTKADVLSLLVATYADRVQIPPKLLEHLRRDPDA
jgi:hypothetical protein